ncbi:MAG: hypothetical protein KM296_03835, partial [Brockia lithotrophica]|nr:hypothetical protein [Brockia lithotrophica]
MGSVLWPTLSTLIWIGMGWLVCARAVEGERRMAGVRLHRGRPRMRWGVFGSLLGGAAVAAFLFVGHALVFSEGIPDSGSPRPPSFSSDFSVFAGTFAVALLLAFLRLRWLRPSV